MMVIMLTYVDCVFFFKQKTAYYMRISDWSSYVCSSDLRSRRTDRCMPLRSVFRHHGRDAVEVDDLDIVALTHRNQILFTQSTHDAGQGFRRKHEMVGDVAARHRQRDVGVVAQDRKSTRLNSSH